MPVHVVHFWTIEIYAGNLHVCLIIIKLGRLKSTRAGASIIQILQELELGPASPKIQRTGGVTN